MTDGLTEIIDLDKTQANKRFAQDFVQDVLIDGKIDRITYYISTETYHQHNPGYRRWSDWSKQCTRING